MIKVRSNSCSKCGASCCFSFRMDGPRSVSSIHSHVVDFLELGTWNIQLTGKLLHQTDIGTSESSPSRNIVTPRSRGPWVCSLCITTSHTRHITAMVIRHVPQKQVSLGRTSFPPGGQAVNTTCSFLEVKMCNTPQNATPAPANASILHLLLK